MSRHQTYSSELRVTTRPGQHVLVLSSSPLSPEDLARLAEVAVWTREPDAPSEQGTLFGVSFPLESAAPKDEKAPKKARKKQQNRFRIYEKPEDYLGRLADKLEADGTPGPFRTSQLDTIARGLGWHGPPPGSRYANRQLRVALLGFGRLTMTGRGAGTRYWFPAPPPRERTTKKSKGVAAPKSRKKKRVPEAVSWTPPAPKVSFAERVAARAKAVEKLAIELRDTFGNVWIDRSTVEAWAAEHRLKTATWAQLEAAIRDVGGEIRLRARTTETTEAVQVRFERPIHQIECPPEGGLP